MVAYAFGSGTLIGVRTDLANQTPAVFGVVQDVSIDFSFSLKELLGQYQAPVAIGRGAMKITSKAKTARIYAAAYNSLFFGQTQTTGALLQAVNEAGTIPTTPFQVTVANAANFQTDLGVFYAATGVQLTRVASGPTTGQYSVNTATGVYTFAAADTGLLVQLSYTYTAASGAQKITLSNQLMGSGPTFQINIAETYNSKVLNIQLNANVASKLNFPFKNQDFVMNDFEWQSLADASGTIGTITCSEQPMTDCPTITLAGTAWPVKPLVVLQLRVVVPAIMRLTRMVPTAITEEQFADLAEVVYQAIAPGQTPPLKKDDFMALPISLLEMMNALHVIMAQAGLVKRADAGEALAGESLPGEAPAASPPTGTPS